MELTALAPTTRSGTPISRADQRQFCAGAREAGPSTLRRILSDVVLDFKGVSCVVDVHPSPSEVAVCRTLTAVADEGSF